MSDNPDNRPDNSKDGKCCKDFADSACPCLDPATGARNCRPAQDKPQAPASAPTDCCGPGSPCRPPSVTR